VQAQLAAPAIGDRVVHSVAERAPAHEARPLEPAQRYARRPVVAAQRPRDLVWAAWLAGEEGQDERAQRRHH
jgi:hypothetical protein